MSVFAVIPVKSLLGSKRRLSDVFSNQERSLLTLAMLEDVLRALHASIVDEIVIVGSDSAIQRMADRF
ncbi:MAG: 2-phospho-L-lactate guanylyltransferase, partial [Crenarchaeota archaeon]|nr:2-phospho-L-lactate guanylyltransferase [Thermoproteota archaeon]